MQMQKNWQQAAGNGLAGPGGGKKVALFKVLSNENDGLGLVVLTAPQHQHLVWTR